MNAEKRAETTVPKYKKDIVDDLAERIKNSRTVLIASTKGLPGSKFHLIKKKLRGKAEILVAKKSLVLRAIGKIEKGVIQNLKGKIGSDIALFFSDLDAFELSGVLGDNESPTKAKGGETASEDIVIEPGPTDLMPGPAISELSGVGLKVAVEDGKLAIKKRATVVKAGEVIDAKVASVLGKLNINPIMVGFEPVAAYDSKEDKLYTDIKIDKEGTLEALRIAISKGLGFAVDVGYISEGTIALFVSKAGVEYKMLEKLVGGEKPAEEEAPPGVPQTTELEGKEVEGEKKEEAEEGKEVEEKKPAEEKEEKEEIAPPGVPSTTELEGNVQNNDKEEA